ncbi:MAG: (Fe-S)-binding protein, partial [Fervidobacterium sp.]
MSEIRISDDLLTQCMHCGMCLSVCPTYALTGLERSSPRGRIRLMKSVMDGTIAITTTFVEEMNFCLDCQACETACPAGVKYGLLVETARTMIDDNRRAFNLKRFILKNIVTKRKILFFTAKLLRIYQKIGLDKLALFILSIISPSLKKRAELMPRISDKFSIEVLPEISQPGGAVRGTVAVLTGCVMDVFYADVNFDTVEVLLKNGWETVIPHQQVCCGSLSAHNGDHHTARELARKNIEAFEKSRADYIVVNSAGCGAFMKQYAELLSDDPEFKERARLFSTKIKDFSEFLYETSFTLPESKVDIPITYHEACHLVHAQKVSVQPRSIVKEISGDKYRELNEASWCCGSAGIYNVIHYDEALKLLERKIANIKRTNASIVITGNPGCMGQISYGVRKDK